MLQTKLHNNLTDNNHKILHSNTFNDSFRAFFISNFNRLCNYASHIVDNNMVAEDIVQDSFFQLWEKSWSDDIDKNRSFLYKVVRNSCLNFIKRRQVEEKYIEFAKHENTFHELYEENYISDNNEKERLYNNLMKELNSVLNKLPEKSREIFEMNLFENLTQKEISELKGIGLSTVERHISKAKKFIRFELSKGGYKYSLFILYMLTNQ